MQKLDFRAIGNRIKEQRSFLGYTREYMAEQLSVSVNFCRDIEIGAKGMSLQTFAHLSNILKLSTDYILFGKTSSDTLNDNIEPLILMLDSCKPEKRKFAEDMLKLFLLAME